MKTAGQVRIDILERAADDEGFRARLLEDPPGTIEKEPGIGAPEGPRIKVQDSADTTSTVLASKARLEAAALAAVSASHVWSKAPGDDDNDRKNANEASDMFRGVKPVLSRTAMRDEFRHEEDYEEALAQVIARRAGIRPFQVGYEKDIEEPVDVPPARLDIEEFPVTGGEEGLRGLERLFCPLGSRAFHQTQYERARPMLFRGPRERFHHLVSWETLTDLIYNRNLHREQLQVAQDGNYVPEHLYSYVGNGFGSRLHQSWHSRIDPQKLEAFVRNGASVILNSLQTIHEPARALISEIENGMAIYAGVNLYATWRATPCFSTHWDDHDVYILQVRGRKVWRLWGEVRREPLRRDVEPNQVAPSRPLWTGSLDEGDVLYIPRGWWHSAHVAKENDGRGTIHLTLSPHNVTGTDFLGWVAAKVAAHEGLRRNVPLYANEESLREFLLEYRKVVDAALVEAGEGALLHDLQRAWQARATGQFLQQIDPWRSEAWEELELSIRGWEQARVVGRSGEGVFALCANGQQFEFDARCLSLIELLLDRGAIRVGEFLEIAGASFTSEFASDFAVRLIKEGVVVATERNTA